MLNKNNKYDKINSVLGHDLIELYYKAILRRGQMANKINFGISRGPGAGSIARPTDLQSRALLLCYIPSTCNNII